MYRYAGRPEGGVLVGTNQRNFGGLFTSGAMIEAPKSDLGYWISVVRRSGMLRLKGTTLWAAIGGWVKLGYRTTEDGERKPDPISN